MSDSLDAVFEEYSIHPYFHDLRQHAQRVVRDVQGNEEADVVFIGEAPGRNEDRLGRPFIGSSGRLLDELLASVDLQRSQVYVTNVVKYRPVEPLDGKNRQPTPQEHRDSLPFLKREMRIIKPKVIVTLGAHALRAILPDSPSISVVHGTIQMTPKGKLVIPLYHPATALYNPPSKPGLFKDFQTVGDVLNTEIFNG